MTVDPLVEEEWPSAAGLPGIRMCLALPKRGRSHQVKKAN